MPDRLAVVIVVVMVLVLPVAVMLVAAVWSALLGWLFWDGVDEPAEGERA